MDWDTKLKYNPILPGSSLYLVMVGPVNLKIIQMSEAILRIELGWSEGGDGHE
jgi:hypothetical protein